MVAGALALQALMVALQQVPLPRRRLFLKCCPCLGKEPRSPERRIKPIAILLSTEKDAPQHHTGDPLGIRRQVRQGQSDAPGASEDSPTRYPQGLPQTLQVCNQMGGGIVLNRRKGSALTTASLIKENNAVPSGIEKSAHEGGATAAGAAMQDNHRHAVRITAFFHVKLVPLTH